MKVKNTLPYIISVLLFVWIGYILSRDAQFFTLIGQVQLFDFAVSLGISCILFIINGWQLYYLIKRNSGTSIDILDLLVLPASMNLWSYLLPFRGGLVYSMFYIKTKYAIQLIQGFSIGLFTFLLSVSVAGLFGLYLSFTMTGQDAVFTIVSAVLFLCPFLVLWSRHLSKRLLSVNMGPLNGLNKMYLNSVLEFNALLKDAKATVSILISICLSIAVYVFWVYWIVISFEINMNMISIILLAFILRLSVIARIIPGNLGVQELISGASVQLMGGMMSEGILIALFIRATAFIIALILGIYSFLTNIEHFKTISFIELWKKFKSY